MVVELLDTLRLLSFLFLFISFDVADNLSTELVVLLFHRFFVLCELNDLHVQSQFHLSLLLLALCESFLLLLFLGFIALLDDFLDVGGWYVTEQRL